jgi:hypothetical protein
MPDLDREAVLVEFPEVALGTCFEIESEEESSDLLRDGVEISLEKLDAVESSNPHFMFIGRHGELFATVRMHDSSTGENRIVSHEDECTGETERSAYRECIQRGEAIAMGSTVAEPVR